MVVIFRLGSAIAVPFLDTSVVSEWMDRNASGGNFLEYLNTISGGALSKATLFSLSITPYINASIIIQLLCIAIPALERLAKDGGEEGKKKIQSITRYTTVGIGLLQGFGYYTMIKSYGVLTNESVWGAIVIILAFMAGSSFVMWLGE